MSLPPPLNWLQKKSELSYRVIFSEAVFPHHAGIGYFSNRDDAVAFLKSGIILSMLNSMNNHADSKVEMEIDPETWNGMESKIGYMNPQIMSVKFDKGEIEDDNSGKYWEGDITITNHLSRRNPRMEDQSFTTNILIAPDKGESFGCLDYQKMICQSPVLIIFDWTLFRGKDAGEGEEFVIERFAIQDNIRRAYMRHGWNTIWAGYWKVMNSGFNYDHYTAMLQQRRD